MVKIYPAKLLVFGEYTVINKSEAFAIPINLFYGHWDFSDKENIKAVESNKILNAILYYLESFQSQFIAIDKFRADINNGIWFNSNIPYGYGLGSSGALVAAIYEKYCIRKSENLSTTKHDLGRIESFFHGTSSGTDPLVSFLNQPLKIDTDQSIKITPNLGSKTNGTIQIFILDCGFARSSNNLVNLYMEYCTNITFKENFVEPLKRLTSLSIDALLNNKNDQLKILVKNISELQFLHMKKMIPEQILDLWAEGLQSNLFNLKLCGAGGGGFMLGFCYNKAIFDSTFKNFSTYKVFEI